MKPVLLITGLLLSMVLVPAAAADPLDDAVAQMQANEAKVQSCTAKSRMTQEMDLGGGNMMKSQSSGTLEWTRKGDKKLFRSEMRVSSTQKFGEQEVKRDQHMLMISDGDYFYTLSDEEERKAAYKQKAGPDMDDDPKSIVENLKEEHNVKLLPDEKVEGADCYVIEAEAKDQSGEQPVTKQLLYFRKDSGVNVKMEGLDKSGKAVVTHTLSDLKLNSEIPADHFVFKAPPGVEVIDMSQLNDPGRQP